MDDINAPSQSFIPPDILVSKKDLVEQTHESHVRKIFDE